MTTPIAARVPYTPTKLSGSYNARDLFLEFGKVQRAIPPMLTRIVVAATTIATTDDTILGDTTAGNFAITLLPADQVQFLRVTIKNIGTGTLTITGTIDATVNPTLAQWKSRTIQSDGIAWYLLSSVP